MMNKDGTYEDDNGTRSHRTVEIPFIYITSEQASNLRKWIDALRSGEYQQLQGELYKDNRYCCLGVANCVIGTDPANSEIYTKTILHGIFGLIGYAKHGLDDDWFLGDVKNIPIEMNDQENLSFNEIADVLEDYLNLCKYANETENAVWAV